MFIYLYKYILVVVVVNCKEIDSHVNKGELSSLINKSFNPYLVNNDIVIGFRVR